MKSFRTASVTILFLLVATAAAKVLAPPVRVEAQTRHVKVTVNFHQSAMRSREEVAGSGGVIITRRGTAQPSARLRAQESQTTAQRSTGIFILVRDGSESILSVAAKVPYRDAVFYRDYATGAGYVAAGAAFQEVGTYLKVSATVVDQNQIRVRLTPRISYFSAERPGAIDFTEAATELIVPNGQPVSLGGADSRLHEITRHIFGYGERRSTEETAITLTAAIQ